MGGAATALTVTEALLLAVFGSVTLLATMAVSVRVPAALGITWITTDALPPTARMPSEQERTAVPLHPPWLGCAETKETPGGRLSESTVPVATEGPALETLRV